MRISILLLLTVILALTNTSCQKKNLGYRTYDLDYQSSVKIARDLDLTFNTLIEDSRCPKGTDCVWEGRAVLGFVLEGGTEDALVFNLTLQEGQEEIGDTVLLEDYRLRLLEVTPYPGQSGPRPAEEYRARVLVDTSR